MGERIWIVQGLPLSSGEPDSAAGIGAAFPNMLEVMRELGRDGDEEGPFMRRRPWPAASELEVTITDPALALDWLIVPFGPVVSARLRAAWSGASDGVEYRAVDASRSCAEAQAADYRQMHVMAEECVVIPRDPTTTPRLSGRGCRKAFRSMCAAWQCGRTPPPSMPFSATCSCAISFSAPTRWRLRH